ncbi:MAG: primosomal protein N' [Marinobacterium sp.]
MGARLALRLLEMLAMIVRVALPVPLNRLFDYAIPQGVAKPAIGARVLVKFGQRSLIGMIHSHSDQTDVPSSKLKPFEALLDQKPLVNAEQIKLGEWAASYYKYPLGDALIHLLPNLARKEQHPFSEPDYWRLTEQADIESLPKRAVRQRALFTLIENQQTVSTSTIREAEFTSQVHKALIESEQVEKCEAPLIDTQQPDALQPSSAGLALNAEQQRAVDLIKQSKGFSPILLVGVTGSGKTEVYLQSIEQALADGKQVLILVPEIGLTPQLVERFTARFNTKIASLHSGLTDRMRFDAWQSIRSGETRIVIGTRSAIFIPFANLGMIVIDEEHDPSFKQQEGFRYHARDLALVRAKQLDIPVIMGSATPALESLLNVQQGRFKELQLTQRAGRAAAPSFELLDVKGVELDTGLAPDIISRINDHITLGNQVLVFINRRGFAPTLTCQDCGSTVDCTRCDARMTLHRKPPKLHCHHCDRQTPIPRHCQHCGSDQLRPAGSGTERIEQRLSELFTNTSIKRVDRDSTHSRHAFESLMNEVNGGDPCILVGTQMLAKGHHFPNVTLVVIVNTDAGLFSADVRGMERTAQLIMQVAGRAGRAERPGEVVLQTQQVDHPLLNTLVTSGYLTFAEQELMSRKQAQLPPFAFQAIIRAEAKKQGWAEAHLMRLRRALEGTYSSSQLPMISGPFPSYMEKRAGMFRAQLMFTGYSRTSIQGTLKAAQNWLEQDKESSRVRWNIDIDPVDSF